MPKVHLSALSAPIPKAAFKTQAAPTLIGRNLKLANSRSAQAASRLRAKLPVLRQKRAEIVDKAGAQPADTPNLAHDLTAVRGSNQPPVQTLAPALQQQQQTEPDERVKAVVTAKLLSDTQSPLALRRSALLACLCAKFANSHQLSHRSKQIQQSPLAGFFHIDGKKLGWNPNRLPESQSDFNQIVDYFLNQYSDKDLSFRNNLLQVCRIYFPELPVIHQIQQQAREHVVEKMVDHTSLDISSHNFFQKLRGRGQDEYKCFIRDGLKFASDGNPDSQFNKTSLAIMIRHALRLDKIRNNSETAGARLGEVEISTEISGVFNKFIDLFNNSTARHINNFSDRFIDFNQEILKRFNACLGSLGKDAEQDSMRKVQSQWIGIFDRTRHEFTMARPAIENPFNTELASNKMESVSQEINESFSVQLADILAHSTQEFENAFINSLYNSAHALDFSKALASKSSGRYDEYLTRWTQSFVDLSKNFTSLHEQMKKQVLARGQSIGGKQDYILKALAANHLQAQTKLAERMFSAYQEHVDQLMKLYTNKIDNTTNRSSQEEGRILVARAMHYWKAMGRAFDVFEERGVKPSMVAQIKLNKLDIFQKLVMEKHAADTQSSMRLWIRVKDAFSRPTLAFVGALGAGGVVAGVGLALFTSAATGGLAIVALAVIGGGGYCLFLGAHTLSKHFAIQNQHQTLQQFFKHQHAQLTLVAQSDNPKQKLSAWQALLSWLHLQGKPVKLAG